MADLVIRNAHIVDGTGAPAFGGDISVDGSTITSVDAPGAAAKGAREIDADGRLVTPGWVDVHTHYDGQVTWDPGSRSAFERRNPAPVSSTSTTTSPDRSIATRTAISSP